MAAVIPGQKKKSKRYRKILHIKRGKMLNSTSIVELWGLEWDYPERRRRRGDVEKKEGSLYALSLTDKNAQVLHNGIRLISFSWIFKSWSTTKRPSQRHCTSHFFGKTGSESLSRQKHPYHLVKEKTNFI